MATILEQYRRILAEKQAEANSGTAIKNGGVTTPILIANGAVPVPDTFAPVGMPSILCAPGFTGPDCRTPLEPLPTSPGGNGVVTQPVADIPATPDVLPWWKRVATAIIPDAPTNGQFGPSEGGFGPSYEPPVSAAGPTNGKRIAMAGFGAMTPAMQNLMLIGGGLLLLSFLAQQGKGRR